MSDERDTSELGRLAELIPPPDDGFDRLTDRRNRHRRNRRITAGVVGMSLTAAVVFGAYQFGRNNTPIGPAEDPLPAAAGVGRIECTTEGAKVLTSHVAAQPDGVHLELLNPGEPALYSFEGDGFGFGDRAELDVTPLTYTDLTPGTVKITCYDESVDPSVSPPKPATFQVVDPSDVYVSTKLDCENVSSAIFDYAPDFTGVEGAPEDIARDELEERLQDGDIVERAGYPEGRGGVARVVREGLVVATVHMFQSIEGGWIINTVNTCSDFDA